MSPSELGEHLKPFVFLGLLEADMRDLAGSTTVHPHSGFATIAVFAEGDVTFDDPRAGYGTLGYGGVEIDARDPVRRLCSANESRIHNLGEVAVEAMQRARR